MVSSNSSLVRFVQLLSIGLANAPSPVVEARHVQHRQTADLSVPSTWRQPINSKTTAESIQISEAAINVLMPQLDSSTAEFNGLGYWQAGNVWSATANHDYYAGTKTFSSSVAANLETAFNLWPNYDQYGQVTPADASAGSIAGKNFTIEDTCDGITMAGGVFWRPTTDDTSINSITTGLFMTVSANLAEITGDSKYTDAAIAAANWIQNLNMNNSIVLDTIDASDCSRSPSTWLFTYNTGKFIEGLSVLSDVTGDSSWNTLMVDTIAVAVKSSDWEGSDGVITEGVSLDSDNDDVGFKAVFIRGLNEAYRRNTDNTDLATLISSYINYNAILGLAANGSTYSSDWEGPAEPYTAWGQLAALDVLVSVIDAN
ncbi:hypothetical protein H0H92_009104 [Tricholoma furcatifolium]|nr:hypothetical protein H0H92_009104 [Tricholoma furcatifolium]